jgi:hypothetical protein
MKKIVMGGGVFGMAVALLRWLCNFQVFINSAGLQTQQSGESTWRKGCEN